MDDQDKDRRRDIRPLHAGDKEAEKETMSAYPDAVPENPLAGHRGSAASVPFIPQRKS